MRLFFAAVVFIVIPVTASRPMTSLFAKQLDASMFEIGVITACYSISPLLLAIFAGRYIDRYGEKIPIFIGSFGILLSLSLPFFFPSIPILYISQLILGAAQLIAILAIQNGVTKSATNKTRDQTVGTFSLFTSLGLLLGPLIGGYAADHLGFQQSYILLALVPIITMLLSIFITNSSAGAVQTNKENTLSLSGLLKIPSLSRSIIVSGIILSAIDMFTVYFPLYAQSKGLSLTEIGWILAARAAASISVRVFMPQLVERHGRVTILWLFIIIGALAFGVIPLLQQFFYFLLAALVLGIGLGITLPITMILSYNSSPPGRTGEVLGLRLASNRLAQTTIPLIFANLGNVLGLGSIFLMEAIMLAIAAFTARRIKEPLQHQDIIRVKKG